jgi:hypothetical protein
MPDNRYRQIATDTDRQLALAYIALTGEHATEGVMHALTILDGLLPLPGTASRCTVRAQTTTRDNTGATE